MRDYSPRIVQVTDVGERYPDPEGVVRGAVVLVDDRVGAGLSTSDYRGRPVLVRYEGPEAARRAVRHRRPGTFGIGWADVVYLPPHFPAPAARAYLRAVTVAIQ